MGIERNEIVGIKDILIPNGQLLCRKLRTSLKPVPGLVTAGGDGDGKTKGIIVPQSARAGAGWLVVVDYCPPALEPGGSEPPTISDDAPLGWEERAWAKVKAGTIVVTSSYAGAPIFDMTEVEKARHGAFYFVEMSSLLLMVEPGSEKERAIYETHEILRLSPDQVT